MAEQESGQFGKMRESLNPAKPEGNIIPGLVTDAYRRTYEGSMGRAVLESQLRSLRMFDEIRNDGERYLHNHGIGLLEAMGIIKRARNGQVSNMRQIVDALISVSQPQGDGAPTINKGV